MKLHTVFIYVRVCVTFLDEGKKLLSFFSSKWEGGTLLVIHFKYPLSTDMHSIVDVADKT